jgi:hypothetical protein
MRLLLTKLEIIVLTIITILPILSPLCLLLIVRPGDYIVNLCDFYCYKFIGKLTAFLHLQEFSLCILPVNSSTTSAPRSPPMMIKSVYYHTKFMVYSRGQMNEN